MAIGTLQPYENCVLSGKDACGHDGPCTLEQITCDHYQPSRRTHVPGHPCYRPAVVRIRRYRRDIDPATRKVLRTYLDDHDWFYCPAHQFVRDAEVMERFDPGKAPDEHARRAAEAVA